MGDPAHGVGYDVLYSGFAVFLGCCQGCGRVGILLLAYQDIQTEQEDMALPSHIYEADLVLVAAPAPACRIVLYGYDGMCPLLCRESERLYEGIRAGAVAEAVSGSVGLHQEIGSRDRGHADGLLGRLGVVGNRIGIRHHIAEHGQDLV